MNFCLPIHHLRRNPAQANWLSGAIALAIIGLSLSPLAQLPDVPGSDKTHHLIAYAVLAIPTAIAIPQRIWTMALLYTCLGGVIELIQPYVNRYGEWLDFIANTAGVLIGSVFGLLVDKYIKH
ncbi:MAG: VanZ family protein [Alphaproteobacteria bacterium]|nr:VanZ family protein [Alphaproteobacteria bacterium]